MKRCQRIPCQIKVYLVGNYVFIYVFISLSFARLVLIFVPSPTARRLLGESKAIIQGCQQVGRGKRPLQLRLCSYDATNGAVGTGLDDQYTYIGILIRRLRCMGMPAHAASVGKHSPWGRHCLRATRLFQFGSGGGGAKSGMGVPVFLSHENHQHYIGEHSSSLRKARFVSLNNLHGDLRRIPNFCSDHRRWLSLQSVHHHATSTRSWWSTTRV